LQIIIARGADFFMQLIVEFTLTPLEYIAKFDDLDMKRPASCPRCQVPNPFHKHGTYWRNIVTADYEEHLPVARFCCKVCRLTTSMLPVFVLPYFQYSLLYIVTALQLIFVACQAHLTPLWRFYRKRFRNNVTRIEMCLRNQSWQDISPQDEKEKARKFVWLLSPQQKLFHKSFTNSTNEILWQINFTIKFARV
jgi:hypothetical protein